MEALVRDGIGERRLELGGAVRIEQARLGLAVWPGMGGSGDFLTNARRFGYAPAEAQEDRVLPAFRLRFRPWATGPLDDVDRALIADLAARYPVAQA